MNIFIFVLISILSVPAIALKNGTVCTVTLNSSDEKTEFYKRLHSKGFEFVELVPNKILASKVEDSDEEGKKKWFAEACENASKIRLKCDVLVVSGHFAGSFFGSSNKTLSLNEMEAQSCNHTCDGILKSPKAVYLFGCNTLAGKDLDSRTPEEYLRVLIADGIPVLQAESIVDARYGSSSSNNRDRMARVFGNSPRIYGFSSIGPAGAHVKNQIQNYFSKTIDYARFLSDLEKERTAKNIDALLTSFREKERVDQFKCSLSNTSVDCINGVCEKNEKLSKQICAAQDKKAPLAKRLNYLNQLLSRSDGISFLSAVNLVLDDDTYDHLISPEDDVQSALDSIKTNTKIKNIALAAIRAKGTTIGNKADWILASLKIGWIDQTTSDSLYRELARDLISNFKDKNTRDAFVGIVEESYEFHKGLQQLTLPEKIDFSKNFESESTDIQISALTILKDMPSDNETIQLKLAKNLYSTNRVVSDLAAWNLMIAKPRNETVEREIYPFLHGSDPKNRNFALQMLEKAKGKSSQLEILKMTNDSDKEVRALAKKLLIESIIPADESIQKAVDKLKLSPETD